MAERRMFSKKIIGSARFLRMPATTRLLYYDLGMYADDDGIVEAFSIMKMTGGTEDDLRVLMAKGFVTVLNDDLVTLINDWNKNNLIRKDRYNESIYKDLLVKLNCSEGITEHFEGDTHKPEGCLVNQRLTDDKPVVNQWLPQDRLGKDRLGKDTKEKEERKDGSDASRQRCPAPVEDSQSKSNMPKEVQALYNSICKSFPKCTALSEARKKAINARLACGYTIEDFRKLFDLAESSGFLKGGNGRNWRATFDWLIKDSNMAKVLDGNYNDQSRNNNSQAKPEADPELDALLKSLEC